MISWLPSAHVAERTAHHYLPIVYGDGDHHLPRTRARIGECLPAVRPTWFFAVPRVWEKLKAGVEAKLDEPTRARGAAGAARGDAARRARAGGRAGAGGARRRLRGRGASCSPRCARRIGLDEATLVNVGAAPTPREVLVFFHALGIPLAEIWGMSETCGAGCSNPGDAIKIGTVGPPSPGVEVKLADGRRAARPLGRS